MEFIDKSKLPFTCPDNGYIYSHTVTYYSSAGAVYIINGKYVCMFASGYNTTGFDTSQFVPVAKGDIINTPGASHYGEERGLGGFTGTLNSKAGLYWIPAKK